MDTDITNNNMNSIRESDSGSAAQFFKELGVHSWDFCRRQQQDRRVGVGV